MGGRTRSWLVVTTVAMGCFQDQASPTQGQTTSSTASSTGPSTSSSTSSGDASASASSGAATTTTTTGMSTGDTQGSTGDVSTTTGPAVCDADDLCLSPIPPQWQGPALRVLGDEDAPPQCTMGHPSQEVAGFTQVIADPGDCTCNCTAQGAGCSLLTVDFYADDTCTTLVATELLDPVCQPLPASGAAFGPGLGEVDTGTCTAMFVPGIFPPQLLNPTALCGPVSAEGTCGQNGRCVPAAPDIGDAYCLWRPGNHDCPRGYPQSAVLFEDFDDDRSCSTCSCEPTPTGTCADRIEVHSSTDANCTGSNSLLQPGACRTTASGLLLDRLSGTVTAACGIATDSTPTGGVQGTDPVTVCCAPLT